MPAAYDTNPFPPEDADRHALWEMIVRKDIDAFLTADWSLVEDDFAAEGFMGIDADRRADPDGWSLRFPDLNSYKEVWLQQAQAFALTNFGGDPRQQLFEATLLRDIEVRGDVAVLHKKFDGKVTVRDKAPLMLRWQTLYYARRVGGRWKLTGFTGYLPNPMMSNQEPEASTPALPPKAKLKQLPAGATQHSTAGPYSPVLEVGPGRLVVISGQAALDQDGNVIGSTIEQQAELTLRNCFSQLKQAGCSPSDVFKVNVYMIDLDEWPRFNAVYEKMLPAPRPVRTAVQAGLLLDLRVEVEMWAIKPIDENVKDQGATK